MDQSYIHCPILMQRLYHKEKLHAQVVGLSGPIIYTLSKSDTISYKHMARTSLKSQSHHQIWFQHFSLCDVMASTAPCAVSDCMTGHTITELRSVRWPLGEHDNITGHSLVPVGRAARLDRRSRLIGRFLDFFPIISDPRFLSVRSGIGRFFCVCTIHEKYK